MSGWAQSTNIYHTNRVFQKITFTIPGIPTLYEVTDMAGKLTAVVGPTNVITNIFYATEGRRVVLSYPADEQAWAGLAARYPSIRFHSNKYYDNVGWVKGLRQTRDGSWGGYIWTMQNTVFFRTSVGNTWVSPEGMTNSISRVLVGTIGDYGPNEFRSDTGPTLEGLTNNPPSGDSSDNMIYTADFTAYYELANLPVVYIQPLLTNVCINSGNVTFTLGEASRVTNGVTWSIIPEGLANGAALTGYASNAVMVVGGAAMSYVVRATANENTNINGEAVLNVCKVESLDATSPKAGASINPPPFEGHKPWPFDVTQSFNPGKHMVVFYKDVIDSSFNVQDFDITLKANLLPLNVSADQLNEVWSKNSGPDSGNFNKTDTFEVKYQNPKHGGVYRFDFDLGSANLAKSEANVVLPLAGAEVDSFVQADIGRANTFATNVIATYSRFGRNQRLFRWFYLSGSGDYRGRPDSVSAPTVWAYNQVDTRAGSKTWGLGVVVTWKNVPVRLSKASNFMVGYGMRRIGISKEDAWLAQSAGTPNDLAATKSWNAGWDVATGSNYNTTVSAMVKDIFDDHDDRNQKNMRLWPNSNAAENYLVPDIFWESGDPDHDFTSPSFLYMTNP